MVSRATTQAAIPGQSGSGGSDTQNYCYDEQDRLVWAANNGTIPSAGNGTCGNATMSATLGGNYTARYAYTNLGQLWQGPQNGTGTQEQYLYCDSSHPHQLSNLSEVSSSPTCASKGTIDYTGSYDAWGNTTSQQRGSTTKSTAYNAQDHLLHWSSTTNQQEWYLYDASGERVLRRSFDGTNTTLTVYAFGLEEHQYAYSGSGSTATNTGNTYYYTLAGRLLGTWDGTSPTTTFLLTDSLGSVVSSFNNPSSGAVMQGNQLYGPYGNQRLKQGSLSTNKGFTGQYNDGLTGLDYYNARYYDPTIGLFLSADAVQGNAGGMDPYAYVGDDPESRTDPTGNLAYSPETGQVAIPQPSGRYVITGYNAGLNGTFNPKVTYTPIAFQPASFWPKPTSSHPVSSSTSAQPKQSNSNSSPLWLLALKKIWATWQVEGQIDQALSPDPTCGTALSFKATTKVATAQGSQAIGSVHTGEKVWAYNPKTRKMELQPVMHVWINHDHDLVDLTITSFVSTEHGKSRKTREVIHTTQKHPFLTPDQGFVPVRQLHVGMHVVKADGGIGTVEKRTVVPGAMTMYNLEVAQDHTFTVGDGHWVVHNCEESGNIDLGGASYSDIIKYLSEQLGIPQDVLDNPQSMPPIPGQSTTGLSWRYTENGITFDMRIHDPNPSAPAGSNSANGWVLRILRRGNGMGKWQLTRNGNWVKGRGPSRTEGDINDAHIPIQDQTMDPTSPFYQGPEPPVDTSGPIEMPPMMP